MIPHNSRLPLYAHCHWHAVVCFTTEKVHTSSSSEARRACMTVKQQDDCVTDSSDYKPRSSFTWLGLFKFGAQIPC